MQTLKIGQLSYGLHEKEPPQDFSHDTYTLTGGYSHPFAQGASVSGFGGYTTSSTVLHAPRDGKIAEILVTPGQHIDTKDLLMRIE